jgi:hypothetical protein
MGTVHTADNTRQRRRSRPHGMLALKKWPNALQGNGEIDPADLVRYKRRTAADKRHFKKKARIVQAGKVPRTRIIARGARGQCFARDR